MHKTAMIISLSAFVLLLSCKKELLNDPFPAKNNLNLKHFGYTLIDVLWDDPTDTDTKSNYLDEVQDFTNVADILVVNETDNIVDRIKLMAESDVKAMLHLNELFFELKTTGGNRSGVIYGIRSDYRTRWDKFVATNKLDSINDLISCFLHRRRACLEWYFRSRIY